MTTRYLLSKLNLYRRLYIWLERRRRPGFYQYYDEYIEYFNHLFRRAAEEGGFNYVLTLLRVSGITTGHWDPYVEGEEASLKFSKMLSKVKGKSKTKDAFRFGLLIYCHATEMSAPYEIMANLLRIINNKPYQFLPFFQYVQPKPGNPFESKPPTVSNKMGLLEHLAKQVKEEKLITIIQSFLRQDIRNAFYHSDYTITEDELRVIGEGSIPKVVPLQEVSEILTKCFAFYSAFSHIYAAAKKEFLNMRKFHRRPEYEVMEFITDKKEGLTGFKIHYSNDFYSYYERKKYEGTMGMNLGIEKEGISLFVGDLSKMKQEWRVNKQAYLEEGTRYNVMGHWRPIITRMNTVEILNKIRAMTKDERIQGILFYIYTTGHKAIEFAIRTDKKIGKLNIYKYPKLPFFSTHKLEIEWLDKIKTKSYIYDGTIYLKSDSVTEIQNALNLRDKFVEDLKQKGYKVTLKQKYNVVHKATPKPTGTGTFVISFRMDDPTHILSVSDMRILPTHKWNIKEEWLK